MALCSYDNELNQKYNINQEIKMTTAQKKAQEAKEIEELRLAEEAKAQQEAKEALATALEEKEDVTDTDVGDMNILEAFELAESGKKLARRGWSKELKKHYVFIKRGETIPSLSNGKHSAPYSPSLPDVMNFDWFDVEEEA